MKPFLSIVIATYNRAAHLKGALESWTKQPLEPPFEIIVVDNGSTDDTQTVIENFKKTYPDFPFKNFFLESPCLSCARNKGIAEASGEYIAFIDDDAQPAPLFVGKFQNYTRRYPGIKAFGGKVLPVYETGRAPAWMSPYIKRLLSIVDEGEKPRFFKRKYPVGCNMIFHRSVFNRVGHFDVPAGLRSEDKHFFLKLKKAGYKSLYIPGVDVFHFIDAWRLKPEYIRKTSFLNGYSDKKILELFPDASIRKMRYFLEMILKISVASGLYVLYGFKGQSVKGRYLLKSMIYTLKGFLAGDKSGIQ